MATCWHTPAWRTVFPDMQYSKVRLLAALALLFTPNVVMAIWLVRAQSVRSIPGYFLAILVAMLLLTSICKTWRWFFLLNFPLFLVGLVLSLYTVSINELPGDSIAYVILTSSWNEALSFFSLHHELLLWLLPLGACLGYISALISVPACLSFPNSGIRTRWSAIGILICLTAYADRNPDDFMRGVAASPVVATIMFFNGPIANANATIHGTWAKKIPYEAQPIRVQETHILIIGESSRRNSWSIYGYARRTTPYMEKLKGEAVFFSNALSDANATTYAVPMLLTGTSPEIFSLGASSGTLLDLAKEAGYFTCWLVNQDAGVSQLLAIDADDVVYPHSSSPSAIRGLSPDGVLLPHYSRELRNHGSALFVGMHIFGSHWGYFDRYPKSFERFGSGDGLTVASIYRANADKRVVDSYDNSVLYTDWFLEQIIERARTLKVPVTVTYVSDHGEDLYALDGRTGHGWPAYSANEFQIPAFVWMNAAYRAAHPDKVQALAANSAKEIRSHDFFYSMADIMGIRFTGEKSQRSFVSPNFVPDLNDRHFAGGNLVARKE